MDGKAGLFQLAYLLGRARELRRVAAFQPDHALARSCRGDEESVDGRLILRMAPRSFADADTPGACGAEIEDAPADQSVLKDDARAFDQAQRFHPQQPRHPGPGPAPPTPAARQVARQPPP